VFIMVKVLGIVGSPRRGGNTEILVRTALESASGAGAETEMIRLSEKVVGPCDGCASCAKTKKCKTDDDFAEVFDKMVAADAILFASPSYFESVTPQMKALIDRAGFFNNRATGRTAFTGKVGGAMVVAYRTGLATTWCQMLIFILAQRMIVPGIASFPNAVASEPGDVLKDKEGMDKAREIGEAMAKLAQRLAKTSD
jgi:multimeric flavodoxin WrbA